MPLSSTDAVGGGNALDHVQWLGESCPRLVVNLLRLQGGSSTLPLP